MVGRQFMTIQNKENSRTHWDIVMIQKLRMWHSKHPQVSKTSSPKLTDSLAQAHTQAYKNQCCTWSPAWARAWTPPKFSLDSSFASRFLAFFYRINKKKRYPLPKVESQSDSLLACKPKLLCPISLWSDGSDSGLVIVLEHIQGCW